MKPASMIRDLLRPACALTLTAVLGGCAATRDVTVEPKGLHEYLLTVSRPNHLHVIDTQTHAFVRSCELPGRQAPGLMALSPDNRIAYVLTNGWENVLGIEVETCKQVFAAHQSYDDVQVKTHGSLAVSPDGKELYTVQNRTRKHRSHFEVLEPRLAVFDTAGGLDAKPIRTFPVDRRITTIAATKTGKVVLGGADLKQIDPKTGKVEMLAELQSWKLERWMTPDAFAMFNGGEQSDEYILPYVTAKFADDTKNMETAEWWWGMNRVDLKTGKVEQMPFTPFEFVIFNFVTSPQDRNVVYGVFNKLSRHDLREKKMVNAVPLDHTYYNINITGDGKRIYVGGTANDIGVYDAETLEKISNIQMPGDMAASDLRMVKLPR
jgi:quinohemoprotein amine dehydrogenase beta subunit